MGKKYQDLEQIADAPQNNEPEYHELEIAHTAVVNAQSYLREVGQNPAIGGDGRKMLVAALDVLNAELEVHRAIITHVQDTHEKARQEMINLKEDRERLAYRELTQGILDEDKALLERYRERESHQVLETLEVALLGHSLDLMRDPVEDPNRKDDPISPSEPNNSRGGGAVSSPGRGFSSSPGGSTSSTPPEGGLSPWGSGGSGSRSDPENLGAAYRPELADHRGGYARDPSIDFRPESSHPSGSSGLGGSNPGRASIAGSAGIAGGAAGAAVAGRLGGLGSSAGSSMGGMGGIGLTGSGTASGSVSGGVGTGAGTGAGARGVGISGSGTASNAAGRTGMAPAMMGGGAGGTSSADKKQRERMRYNLPKLAEEPIGEVGQGTEAGSRETLKPMSLEKDEDQW